MQIQDVMVEYFRKREGPMAKDRISALQKSLAAIYYLPFQCGVNLYFRFSGVQLCLGCHHIWQQLTGLTRPAMPIWLEVSLEGRRASLWQKLCLQCRAVHSQQIRGEA